MQENKWFKWGAAFGLAIVLGAMAAPGAQALTANAFVVRQACLNGDFVQVTLSATVQPNQQVKYRWDFNNDGVFDTAASTNPTVTHRYPDERRVTARVSAVTASGTKAVDTVTFTTKRCGGGGGGGG
jgi:uncharacterized protein (DUF58 family)